MPNNSGFTIIELLMVVVIMLTVGAVMVPVAVDFQQRNDLDVSQTTFAQGVRRAQQLSMSGEGDSQWGVIAVSGKITVFKGNTHSSRDINFDEDYVISTTITLSGQLEYDFAKITGFPTQTGTATLVNGNYQKQVGVNAKGIVNY